MLMELEKKALSIIATGKTANMNNVVAHVLGVPELENLYNAELISGAGHRRLHFFKPFKKMKGATAP